MEEINFELIKNIYNILPIKWIKKHIIDTYKKSKFLINIYGSYEYFIESQNKDIYSLNGDLALLKREDDFKKIIPEINCPLSDWYLCTKITIKEYIKRFFISFNKCYKERNDLNFFYKIYISFIKANRNTHKLNSYQDLRYYFSTKENSDKYLKEQFDNKIINKIYLYKRNN